MEAAGTCDSGNKPAIVLAVQLQCFHTGRVTVGGRNYRAWSGGDSADYLHRKLPVRPRGTPKVMNAENHQQSNLFRQCVALQLHYRRFHPIDLGSR
jgi:hypothetical protein